MVEIKKIISEYRELQKRKVSAVSRMRNMVKKMEKDMKVVREALIYFFRDEKERVEREDGCFLDARNRYILVTNEIGEKMTFHYDTSPYQRWLIVGFAVNGEGYPRWNTESYEAFMRLLPKFFDFMIYLKEYIEKNKVRRTEVIEEEFRNSIVI